jgi:hypothetical protein
MKNIFTIFVTTFLLIIACNKNKENNTISNFIILEVEYRNLAWGYKHSVTLTDTSGRSKLYSYIGNELAESWKSPDSLGYITLNDLQSNYNLCNEILPTINRDTIKQCMTLSKNVTTNNLSGITHVSYDGGITTYFCYVWNNNAKKYKRIFLARCGDWEQSNMNINAITILNLAYTKNSNGIFSCY